VCACACVYVFLVSFYVNISKPHKSTRTSFIQWCLSISSKYWTL